MTSENKKILFTNLGSCKLNHKYGRKPYIYNGNLLLMGRRYIDIIQMHKGDLG